MVLVTGGTGFLGSHLLEQLILAGEEVRCICRNKDFKYLTREIIDKVQWVQGDILDVFSLEKALEEVDEVYHCAAKVSYDPSDRKELYKVNVEGTANVVNACLDKNIRKLVHVSSVAAIGRSKLGQEITEENSWNDHPNNTVYAKTKHLAEMEVWRGMAEGLPVVIVNPPILIGPSLYWEEGAPLMIKRIADGFSYYTEGTNGFADVRDVASIMIKLMKDTVEAERYIVFNENWSYKKLFFTIKKELGVQTHFREANAFQRGIVWRAIWLKSVLFGGKRMITKETAKTSGQKIYYSRQKISGLFPDFNWTPLEKTIKDACQSFKKSH